MGAYGVSGEEALYPLEFHVPGTPVSLQGSSRSKERWKKVVEEAARKRRQDTVEIPFLDGRSLALTIYYFPSEPMVGDIDNIVKPIVDALKGVAYLDDHVIERIVVQKFEPDEAPQFEQPSDQLLAALDATAGAEGRFPVVYVRIDDDLIWRRL